MTSGVNKGTKLERNCESETNSLSSFRAKYNAATQTFDEDFPMLPIFPGFSPVAFFCMRQKFPLRYYALKLITWIWFERASMFVILLNCVTLGAYQPCEDDTCLSVRCQILAGLDHFIFAFFAVEMCIKMVAMGVFGRLAYLEDTWNKLDCFIVLAGVVEYCIPSEGNVSISAIRTIRVLRPLRAINRVPSLRILVTLLLDTMPMLGNVLLLCFFIFFVFGIIGVQLWAGMLRQRCYLDEATLTNISFNQRIQEQLAELPKFYSDEEGEDILCSSPHDAGLLHCPADLPPSEVDHHKCFLTVEEFLNSTSPSITFAPSPPEGVNTTSTAATDCINWNQYYTKCEAWGDNPFKNSISFDNIGMAWVAIFQVISLEGWVDIMYYVQDVYSFWSWFYFVTLVVIGAFFMINLFLVVIATQFGATKEREKRLMKAERAAAAAEKPDTAAPVDQEPGSCYEEFIKFIIRFSKHGALFVVQFFRRLRGKPPLDSPATKRKREQQQPQYYRHICIHRKAQIEARLKEADRENMQLSSAHTHDPSSRTNNNENVWTRRPWPHEGGSPATASGHQKPPPPSSLPPPNSSRTLPSSHSQSPAAIGTAHNDISSSAAPTAAFSNDAEDGGRSEAFYRPTMSDIGDTESLTEFSETCSECRHVLRKPNKLRFFCQSLNQVLFELVEHRYFQNTILIAILVNTLSMGVEHHNQPDELTHILEVTNYFFTFLFCLEMLLKIAAYGPIEYISNGFNVFDGIIVIISLVELLQDGSGGLSVLRTFRLLRILRMVHFLPALKRQLGIMVKTMENVTTFFALFLMFMFIFRSVESSQRR